MSKIKNMLNSELEHYEYNGDIEVIKNSGSLYKKRCKKILIFISSFIFIFITTSAMFLISKADTRENTENNSSDYSFFIVASALDSKTKDSIIKTKNIPNKDIILLQTRFGCTYYVHGNEKYDGVYEMGDKRLSEIFARKDLTVNKSFAKIGDDTMWVEGKNITKVKYTAKNGTIYNHSDYSQSKTIIIKNVYGINNKVSWLPPTELTAWMKNENTKNKPVDFSKAPQDTVTITVTYSNGSTAKRTIKLYYNKYGYLVIETENGKKYNDCKLNDYKKWKSNVYYNENGEEILWDYNGRVNNK